MNTPEPMRTEPISLFTERLATCVRRHGHADASPILFLHGSFAAGSWWQPLFDLLPSELLALAPDLRGHGCAASAAPDFSIATLTADVDAIATALELSHFDLVAHAAAAAVAIEFALNVPDRVRTLTLINPAPVEGVATPPEALALLARMHADRGLLQQAMAGLLPAVQAASPALFGHLVEEAAAMAPAAFTGWAEALGRWDRFADVRRLTLPTLLVWGDADPLLDRATMTRTLVAIPGAASLEVLRGVGHAPMLEDPLLLAEKLVDFVTEDFAAAASIRRRASE